MTDRFLNISDGVAMLVTDLHGDRDAFDRYMTRFRTLHHRGQAQRLILMGDLIHGYGPADADFSLRMVLDVIALRDELGPDTVIMLLGNHEMPHIYGVSLSKGDLEFTPRFEHTLGPRRDTVLSFFQCLPFYVRTAAGVMLAHAGPAIDSIAHVDTLRRFDHRAILDEADQTLASYDDLTPFYQQYGGVFGVPYPEHARYSLAIQGPDDPRYPHLLRAFLIGQQDKLFQVLWDALFTQNEAGLAENVYLNGCQQFLSAFSVDAPAEQQVIVSGHIVTSGGYTLVNKHHLRLSSAAHARPRETGRYLLLDCARPVQTADALLYGLGQVFSAAPA